MAYAFKTTPFAHQKLWFDRTCTIPAWGIWWEQGTGKTKLGIDTAAALFEAGEITALFIVAPNGVHRNWVSDELPKHLPDRLVDQTHTLLWHSALSNRKGFQELAYSALKHPGLLIVAMSYDAMMTQIGAEYAKLLLTKRRCFYILDESSRIKNPGAKRTKRILASARFAPYRRVMNGTPVDNSPFDVYTQAKFLRDDIWFGIGCGTFAAFKATFGVFTQGMNWNQNRSYQELVSFKNLELLKSVMDTTGCRVTKEEVFDLPPKLYQKRYFELGTRSRNTYNDLRDDFVSNLAEGEISAAIAIVRLGRLQQITSGFVPVEPSAGSTELAPILDLDVPNPRIELLREIVDDTPGKIIVWAKYTRDIDLILAALHEDGVRAVRYDGQVKDQDRAAALTEFRQGAARVFVSKVSVGGLGITLVEAKTVIYYNNTFRLSDRLQSEDRAHRHGQTHAVTYIDLIAQGTVDEQLVDALREKREVASFLTGDQLRAWL